MRVDGTLAWWAIALTCVASCNQIFGLEPPRDDERNADARALDAAGLDAAADRDDDGVDDDVDLCPDVADPGQFDEDGDGRGDRCDGCPHLAQASDADGDADTIPDACDPFPAEGGGRLRWNGFHEVAELGDWSTSGGGVAALGDDAVALTPMLDGVIRFVRFDAETTIRTRTKVLVALAVGTLNSGGAARRAIGAVANAVNSDLFLCQIQTDLPVTEVRLADYRLTGMAAAAVQSLSVGPTWPTDEDVEIELDITSGNMPDTRTLSCRGALGAGTAALLPTDVSTLPQGLAGVRVVGVPVRVRWIAIIDHP